MSKETLITFEYGAMSSRYSLQAESKFIAYVAFVYYKLVCDILLKEEGFRSIGNLAHYTCVAYVDLR